MKKKLTPRTLFGMRLRDARLRTGLPQDRLGVLIGLDEETASARISRYETGVHTPPFELVERMAEVLGLPAAYFYCRDDKLAELISLICSSKEAVLDEFLARLRQVS